ncbi:MAG: LLM class flavin-dependent oxidoreductase [Alphaproteobacteria bacterium]|jgi:luciferase family oxidoreductase group 1|uniref:LLM class flavin-dependent oxidoreductase n=1 Tax=Pseudorhizobium pelagicum TaxID=1509405 RepID=UPI001D891F38|nr:LLM class flavin-dependent oxidoreductase [Alphaproteobacteria bacterium]MBU1548418.1 LLM class flavin-dependent oxidoreductase [Alphaproteobacteria bacterium]MBU2335820.1 LLM class flavin-dependent oxidoreductase [Alphaproteobacteria bacterium]MBU2390785.1 LLM class flavin-dependent oxidoreductase [Alphaproteobacteria bacterium]|tara:strand:- start:13081 stop:14079 length:999 start_codon:yes stop_codon:yes gene_type:complete
MIPFSILDLSPVPEGLTVSDALNQSRLMAIKAEEQGYNRLWLAEHHGMPGIASAATSIVIGHVAAATKRIRVGSGGVMLPNHSPLVIAEQFGTLAALFPDRIDLGLGRAPGTDMRTARALRRNLDAGAENFPHDIVELQRLLGSPSEDQAILAVPGANTNVPLWLLGSSVYSAHLAAALGLPYAFASHFAPDMLMEALDIYRDRFQPSETLDKPYVMVGVMGVAADTDEEAARLFTSAQQQFVNLRKNVRGQFPRPVASMDGHWTDMERMTVEHTLRFAAVGSPATVGETLSRFLAETEADELIVSMPIHDIEARLKSVELFAGLPMMEKAH